MPPGNRLTSSLTECDWDSADALIQAEPSLVKKWTSTPVFLGFNRPSEILPFHQAIALENVPIVLLQRLLLTYPKAIEKREVALQRLPLHIALKSNPHNDDIILFILNKYPNAVNHQDNMGRLPIHYACSNQASLNVLIALHKASLQSVFAADNMGYMPLHVASNSHSSIDLIQYLLDAGPGVIMAKTNKDLDPIKCAEASNALNKEAILNLLKNARETFAKTDPVYNYMKEARRREKEQPQTSKLYGDKHWGVRKQLNDEDAVGVV